MVDVSGRTSRTYDEQGRVTSKFVLGLGTSVYTYDNVTGLTAGQVFKLDTASNTVTIVKQFDKEHWILEEEDRFPYPLPLSTMTLQELKNFDTPINENDNDRAFAAFGSEYVCRILGNPLFALKTIDKKCECCSQEMKYLATICSEDYDSTSLIHENFSFFFGESYIYFHFCSSCDLLETESQST
ncbi:rRNA methylase [Paenibacillus sp. M.A.Huq-81]